MLNLFYKKIRYIWYGKKGKELTRHKFYNGYTSTYALIIFAFTLQLVSMFSLYLYHAYSLILCQNRSEIDLALISHMKEMALHNAWVDRCRIPQDQRILDQVVSLGEIQAILSDCQTYVEGSYLDDHKKIILRLYYDDHDIVDLEYVTGY